MNTFHGIPYEPDGKRRGGALFASLLAAVALALFLTIFAYLFFVSLLGTVDMNLNNPALENVDFLTDNPWENLFGLLCFLVAAILWTLLTDRLPAGAVTGAVLSLIAGFGIWFVLSSQSAPTNDSYIVSNAAYRASLGDGSALESVYFKRFPFQLGYVLWSEGILRVFPTQGNYLVIEIINVLCLTLAYFALLRAVRLIWGNGRTVKLCAGLLLITLPPILFCSFTYGNIPSLAFSALALWQILSMKGALRDWLHAILAALCIGVGVSLKKNALILLAAILILLLLRLIRRFTASGVICILLCVLSAWALPMGIQKQYEARFDLKFGEGIPMSSWLAMGLNEAYVANGWYEAKYTVVNFAECGMDTSKAHEKSMNVIRERLDELVRDPVYTRDFFSEKIESQWNEPSFQSIWTNQVRGRYGEMGALAEWICGDDEANVKSFMSASLQFVYLFSIVGACILIWRRRIEEVLLPTCVLGGFLYHTLFEAKSQYIIPYLVLLLPIAARGLAGIVSLILPVHRLPSESNRADEAHDRRRTAMLYRRAIRKKKQPLILSVWVRSKRNAKSNAPKYLNETGEQK